MKILAVDDEEPILNDLILKLKSIDSTYSIKGFTNPLDAFDCCKTNFTPDIAFLDIEMFGINGLSLAQNLQQIHPNINIIFITGFSHYALDAFSLHASGYLTKPIRVSMIQEELSNLRNPISTQTSCPIKAQTFGNFELFFDNQIMKFGRNKSKEIIAYLVDLKGSSCTNVELAAVLWEDKEYTRSIQNQLQVLISDMFKTLRNYNAEHIILKGRNSMAIDVNAIDCDLYHYLNGDISNSKLFTGKYMSNYSWSEITLGTLYHMS